MSWITTYDFWKLDDTFWTRNAPCVFFYFVKIVAGENYSYPCSVIRKQDAHCRISQGGNVFAILFHYCHIFPTMVKFTLSLWAYKLRFVKLNEFHTVPWLSMQEGTASENRLLPSSWSTFLHCLDDMDVFLLQRKKTHVLCVKYISGPAAEHKKQLMYLILYFPTQCFLNRIFVSLFHKGQKENGKEISRW